MSELSTGTAHFRKPVRFWSTPRRALRSSMATALPLHIESWVAHFRIA